MTRILACMLAATTGLGPAQAGDCDRSNASICSACAGSLADGLQAKALRGEAVVRLGEGSFTQMPSMTVDRATIRLVYPDAYVVADGHRHRAFAECEVNMGSDQIDFARMWFRQSEETDDRLPLSSQRLGLETGPSEEVLQSMGPTSIAMLALGPNDLTHRNFR